MWAGIAGLVGALALASGPSTVDRSCESRDAQRGAEVEPALAVSPAEPRAAVAAWQQDPYRAGGGAAALGLARSDDGGLSWAPADANGLTGCLGRKGRVLGTSLTAGPDGTFYLAVVRGRVTSSRGLESSVVVSTSRDAGATWAPPRTLDGLPGEHVSVTADPLRPGRAYAVWTRLDGVLVSRTGDGGDTWSSPATVASGQVLDVAAAAVLPDGGLVAAVWRSGRRSETLAITRSADEGANWSRPVRLAVVADSALRLRSSPVAAPAIAAGTDGRTYAAWTDVGRRGLRRVLVARSADGGATWSSPRVAVGGTTHALAPSLAVAADGSVAVGAYRLRRRARADVVAGRSLDGGLTWSQRRVSNVFGLARAPSIHGGERFLGDNTALAPAPGGFALAAAVPRPFAASGPSDIAVAPVPSS